MNLAHSNFGFNNGGTVFMDKHCDHTTSATGIKIDRSNQSVEPPDCAKGQVARILFYMATRYEADDDHGDEKMPDLYLVDYNQKVKEPMIGDLCTLLLWNNKFRPTNFEYRRNDRIMELQGNRNPFIDNPDWANLIWRDLCHKDKNLMAIRESND